MNRLSLRVFGFLALTLPMTGSACEPILPLAQLLGGSSAAGPVFFTQSLFWLLMAIGIKSIAFSCFEKRLSWTQAAFFMLIANVVSTVPGVLLASLAASGPLPGLVFSLPVAFVLGMMVQRRVTRLPPSPGRSVAVAVAYAMFYVASVALYLDAQDMLDRHSHATYWGAKFLFVALVACMGIVISAVLEESVIARLSVEEAGNVSFYTSVIRANYITLGAILLVAAVAMLPKRLRSPDFLTSWLDQLCATIGLT